MNKELLELLLKSILSNDSVSSSAKEPAVLNNPTFDFWVVGKKYFIRTVTMHLTGELVAIDDKEIHLKTACWIADSGRFHDALRDGTFSEVEPFINDVVVNRGALVDATIWFHDLPVNQK